MGEVVARHRRDLQDHRHIRDRALAVHVTHATEIGHGVSLSVRDVNQAAVRIELDELAGALCLADPQ
jgi:hypothetical protein